MSHTFKQQMALDHITSKQRVHQEPTVMEEFLQGIGAVVLAVAVVGGAYMIWIISQDYFKYFIRSVFSK